MKRYGKITLSYILIAILLIGPVTSGVAGLKAYAVSSSDINASSVFLKQHTSVTCTLTSAAMMMRRTAIISEINDWEEITEENIKSDGWVDGIGLLWNFKSYNMTVGHGYFSGADNKLFMIDLLEKYPQGIVIYNGGNSGQSHAIVLTDYDEKTDTFYAADPASSAPSGRIKLEESSIVGKTQADKIKNLSSYWYVSSPGVLFADGNYTINKESGNIGSNNNGQSSYDPSSDSAVFSANKKAVDAYYVVSDGSANGAALRYYPSGSSSASSYAKIGDILFVSYIGKNNFGAEWYKTSDGYYAYSGNLTSFNDYSEEVKKFNNTFEKVGNTYTVKAVDGDKTALRLEPSEGNNIIGYAENGKNLYIDYSGVNSIGAQWLRTAEGYYLKASDAEFSSAEKKDDTAFTGEKLTVTGAYSSSPVADSTVTDNSYVTSAALNLRATPVNGSVLTVIPKGETVTVNSVKDGWGQVVYNNQTGWVAMQYISLVPENEEEVADLNIDAVIVSAEHLTTNGSISVSATVSGGSGDYSYSFSICNNAGILVEEDLAFDDSPKRTYRATQPGIYYMMVIVKDTAGNIVTGYSRNVTVNDPLELGSVMSNIDEYTYVYENVVWTSNAKSISGDAKYCYALYLDGKLLSETESKGNIYSYVPEKPGEYVLKVKLKNEFSSSDTVESAKVLVYNNLSIESIKLSSMSIFVDKSASCTVVPTGGTEKYKYCISVFRGGSVIKNGTFSQDAHCEYVFSEPGVYTFFCAVVDSGNKIVSSFSSEITVLDAISGDVDGDGKITASDARLVLRYCAGLTEENAINMTIADVNKDEKVTSFDARIILRCAASIEKI